MISKNIKYYLKTEEKFENDTIVFLTIGYGEEIKIHELLIDKNNEVHDFFRLDKSIYDIFGDFDRLCLFITSEGYSVYSPKKEIIKINSTFMWKETYNNIQVRYKKFEINGGEFGWNLNGDIIYNDNHIYQNNLIIKPIIFNCSNIEDQIDYNSCKAYSNFLNLD